MKRTVKYITIPIPARTESASSLYTARKGLEAGNIALNAKIRNTVTTTMKTIRADITTVRRSQIADTHNEWR
jgi:hypothetical protein